MHLMFEHRTVRCYFIAGNGENETNTSHGFNDVNSCLSSILHELVLITANVKYSMNKVYSWISQTKNPKKMECKPIISALTHYFILAHQSSL